MTVSKYRKRVIRSETPVRRRSEGATTGMDDGCPEKCPGCGNTLGKGYAFCPHCGKNLKKTCPSCGKPVEGGWKACPSCGTSLDPREVRQV